MYETKVKYGQEVRKNIQESQLGTDVVSSESWIFFSGQAPPKLVCYEYLGQFSN